MRFRKTFGGVIAAVTTAILAACSGAAGAAETAPAPAAPAAETAAAPETSDILIGFAVSTMNNPVFVEMTEGIEDEAALNGVSVTVADGQDDPLRQANDILDFIAMGVDLALINPVDGHAAVASVEALNEAGIPVITLGRRIHGGDIVAHIGTNNILAGEDGARYFFEAIGGEGRVAILEGIPGSSSAVDRLQGVHNILPEFPGIEIVASQTANWQRSEAMTVTENILQANADLDAILSLNDEMALGALEALRSAGRFGEVPVMGMDGTDDAVAAVAAGELLATFDQQSGYIGRRGIRQGLILLGGATIEDDQPTAMPVINETNYTDFQ